MKILFLVPYPLGESPSQRFRFEQYFQSLTKEGHFFDVQTFLDADHWRIFFKSEKSLHTIVVLVKGFFKRLVALFKIGQYEIVFIHREAAPIGPPVFEWIISKIFRKKIIYDFDDAIWMTDRQNESMVLKTLKWRSKVKSICRWSYKISCGNQFLCSYAKQFNGKVYYNPTTIDPENVHNPSLQEIKKDHKVIIGWTGSHSTLKYLKDLESVLQ